MTFEDNCPTKLPISSMSGATCKAAVSAFFLVFSLREFWEHSNSTSSCKESTVSSFMRTSDISNVHVFLFVSAMPMGISVVQTISVSYITRTK